MPVEKDKATTRVRLVVSAGLKISTFLPVPSFARTAKADSNGVITEVTLDGPDTADGIPALPVQRAEPG